MRVVRFLAWSLLCLVGGYLLNFVVDVRFVAGFLAGYGLNEVVHALKGLLG
ncbi:MAG: hypothetical protein HY521_13510 [Proteobacteria bacterium]|nr:hypothetical protein [Pseudomonadota bacterium]